MDESHAKEIAKIAKLERSVEIIEKAISSVADSMSSVDIIRSSLSDCKKFREKFEERVIEIVNKELDSKNVMEDLKTTITNEVGIYLNKKDVREALEASIHRVIDGRIKDIKINAIAWVATTIFSSSLVTSLVVAWVMK